MKYSYKIQIGDSVSELSFEAENKKSKPSSQMSFVGSSEAQMTVAVMMSDSASIEEFEEKVGNHGGCSWIDDPNPPSSSSGMSWGSSSASDDDE